MRVEEQERTSRNARLADGSSVSGSPSSGGSHGSQHSSRSHRWNGSRHGHRFRRRSRHRSRTRGLPLPCTEPKFKGACAVPVQLRRRAFEPYQKFGVANQAAGEPAYTVPKGAKDCIDRGATQKQFKVGDGVRIRIWLLNRLATKIHSKSSKLYPIMAAKRVVATVEHPGTRDSLSASDNLSFRSRRVRGELAQQPFPFEHRFRCDSNSY